jgi:hypothetical protein
MSRVAKGQVLEHITQRLETYNPATQKRFVEVHLPFLLVFVFVVPTCSLCALKLQTVGWLHEWACSRSYGLGTKLPWDEKVWHPFAIAILPAQLNLPSSCSL